MTRASAKYRLLTPGPVPLAPEVLSALAQPVVHHRTPEFEGVLARVGAGLRWLFRTAEPVLPLTATGSGAMEAALVNTLSPGDKVLALNIGKFGERWADMARRFGYSVVELKAPWGHAIDLNEVQKTLKTHGPFAAVLAQAVETSTATMNPIFALAQLIKSHPDTLFLVDAITGIGAMELKMDEWGLDVVVAGSQKAFMLPTGLSFVALSKAAQTRMKTAKTPRYYFDLTPELKANAKNQTHFSSANTHLVALDVVLKMFHERGHEWLRARCETLARATRAAALHLGLKIFSHSPAPSVTALEVPATIDGAKLRDHLEIQHRITIMGGQDSLAGKILRIGHLGYITDEDQVATTEALGDTLNEISPGFLSSAKIHAAVSAVVEELGRGPHVP